MKRRLSTKGVVIAILSITAVLLLFFAHGTVADVYRDTNSFIKSLFSRSFSYEQLSNLEMENQSLRFQIEKMEENRSLQSDQEKQEALVYSQYPFSGKESIILNQGKNDGIAEGMPVISNGFLIGVIKEVSNNQSRAQTLFDPEWKSSVAIGEFGNKAVLEGAGTPSLNLIPDNVDVAPGDEIFNVSSDFPIYQLIGTVDTINNNDGDIWQSGTIDVPYDLDEIKTVEILINFP